MGNISKTQIAGLHKEFSAEKDYWKKLLFFDMHFNLIPYLFFPFDPALEFLNRQEKVNVLMETYKLERTISNPLKRLFFVRNKPYVFDITPQNSYPAIFNSFVINKFISEDENFNAIIKSIEKTGYFEEKTVIALLKECNEVLVHIEKYRLDKKKRNFRIQFITVFFDGYNDYLSGGPKVFRHRKKIIELYLYSQGLLFCRYHQILKLKYLKLENLNSMFCLDDLRVSDWTDQILLLKKMGLLDVMIKKLNNPVDPIIMKQFPKIVCQIIGQRPEMADKVEHYINLIK